MTSYPLTNGGDSPSEKRTRRAADVPTSLRVTGVVDPSPRRRQTHFPAEDVEGQASPVHEDEEVSQSDSEADGSDTGSVSASPLTLDLPDCFDVSSRVDEGPRLLNSAHYRRLVHPLDRGMLLSFAVSVIYLAAAIAAVCPTLILVCVILPLAVAARRLTAWCCGGGAPVEAYDDFGVRMFDTKPLSGHEEFWVSHRDAVTQCLMTFDGHVSVDRMRQLVEERLLIKGKLNRQRNAVYLSLISRLYLDSLYFTIVSRVS